ncbi:MAG: rhodanese-like domain-containing protein [Lewinellaceae bacterium]|nr:rhodanese-like domain-containing protein [Lewinellaceae bacterium]
MNNEIRYISYRDALAAQKSGSGIIIDVREPAEFRDGHIPYAINLPSTRFTAEDYQSWRHLKVCLVCQTGNRARPIAQKSKIDY